MVKKFYIELPPPTGDDPAADLERVARGLAAQGVEHFQTPLSVARRIPGVLRGSGFKVTAAVGYAPGPGLIDVEPGDTAGSSYGLAIDLGTTNVVGALVDLNSGSRVGETSAVNPQIDHGEDILSRIHHCLNTGGLEELRRGAVDCIGAVARELAGTAGISEAEITCVCVSGNTTMAHLFLGLDPYNICRAPYVPAANRFGFFRAGELGLSINPEGIVYVLPSVGSYVGGDVLAGVLVSGMTRSGRVSLFVDVGTNAEIIIGNRDWLLACAGAAGPALEGGVVKSGMRAMPGAIERVRIHPATFEPEYTVIGGVKPAGLCGSALIDLLAGLFRTGLIDGRGKLAPDKTPRIRERDGVREYVVASGREGAAGADITITENDIDNLIRTKAAMYTALTVVTRELGLRFDELESFYIAGTFGAYIDPGSAVAIGMVPDIERAKFRPLGNSSLAGACRALVSDEDLLEIDRLASMITYKELNVSSEFMSEFHAAMFLPHTDSGLFPGVPPLNS